MGRTTFREDVLIGTCIAGLASRLNPPNLTTPTPQGFQTQLHSGIERQTNFHSFPAVNRNQVLSYYPNKPQKYKAKLSDSY